MFKTCIMMAAVCFALTGASSTLAEEEPEGCRNGDCVISFENGTVDSRGFLADNNDKTGYSVRPENFMTVTLPEQSDIRQVYIRFLYFPDPFQLLYFDADGNQISSRYFGAGDEEFPSKSELSFCEYLDQVPEGCASIQLHLDTALKVVEFQLLTEDAPVRDTLIHMEDPYEQADILFVVAHPDDEHIMMGGIIPLYESLYGVRVQLVYMTCSERERRLEALQGITINGEKHMPVILYLPDLAVYDLKLGVSVWTGLEIDPVKELVEQVRRFRPKVIVTHDIKGEYGHGAHCATAYFLQQVMELAADPEAYPESAEKYGVWSTQKLYLHLCREGEPTVIRIDDPIAAFDGKSGFEMAQLGLEPHLRSQRQAWRYLLANRNWDPSSYSLDASAVGKDIRKTDFMEHIQRISPIRGAGQ